MAATVSGSWLIGVLLCSISSFGTGISKLAIRKSWLLAQETTISGVDTSALLPMTASNIDEAQQQYATRMRYAAYLFLSVANPILDIGALAFASPSILAPFSGVSLAWVVLLSNPVVGETPQRTQVAGALLIMLGEVVVALFGDHSSHNGNHITLDELRDSYLDPPFVMFLAAAFVVECLLIYTMHYSNNKHWSRFAWGVAGGFITGFWNFIKDAITVVQLTGFWNLPWFFFFGLLLLALITAGGGMIIMAECMKRYDATYTSGTYAGSLTLAASIVSAMHYHTFSHLDGCSRLLYPVGLGILMAGVGLLMQDAGPANMHTSERISEDSDLSATSNECHLIDSQTINSQEQDKARICPTKDRAAYLRLRTAQPV